MFIFDCCRQACSFEHLNTPNNQFSSYVLTCYVIYQVLLRTDTDVRFLSTISSVCIYATTHNTQLFSRINQILPMAMKHLLYCLSVSNISNVCSWATFVHMHDFYFCLHAIILCSSAYFCHQESCRAVLSTVCTAVQEKRVGWSDKDSLAITDLLHGNRTHIEYWVTSVQNSLQFWSRY